MNSQVIHMKKLINIVKSCPFLKVMNSNKAGICPMKVLDNCFVFVSDSIAAIIVSTNENMLLSRTLVICSLALSTWQDAEQTGKIENICLIAEPMNDVANSLHLTSVSFYPHRENFGFSWSCLSFLVRMIEKFAFLFMVNKTTRVLLINVGSPLNSSG